MNKDYSILRTVWFFGRGASVASGVTWEESKEWVENNRQERIKNIEKNLTEQMQGISVGKNPYSQLLFLLENKIKFNQKNLFITTNWDYLLQREISSKNYTALPSWLEDSHVFHLNGSIEKWGDARYRSPVLLPDDNNRRDSLEFQKVMALIQWERFFVIVGVSFKYKVDQQIIELLRPHEDNLPFGDGKYLIIDTCQEGLDRLESIIKQNFPRAEVIKVKDDFKSWIDTAYQSLNYFDPFGGVSENGKSSDTSSLARLL